MAAPAIPEISFADLRSRLRPEEHRIPLEGTLETTFRCNLRCAHCYVSEPAASRRVRDRELPLARLTGLLDEIAESGCLGLLLTGGEPLLRPDFPALYLHAVRRGLLVTVFTNGTLVSDRIADLFADSRPERVEVTLYGMTAATYERVTRTPGSFEPCLAGIRRLAARRLPLKLKTMALAWNRHEIAAMRDFATGLGAEFSFDAQLNSRLDGADNRREELQLPAPDVLALDHAEPGRLQELREFCGRFVGSADAGESDRLYTCGAGETSFVVNPYGQLQLCVLARRAGYDLRKGSFARGWREALPRLRARTWQSGSACRTCSLVSLCGSCPAAAELEHGDPEAAVEAFCRIAHLRASAAAADTRGHTANACCCLTQHPSRTKP